MWHEQIQSAASHIGAAGAHAHLAPDQSIKVKGAAAAALLRADNTQMVSVGWGGEGETRALH